MTFSGYTKGDVFVSYERRQTERVTLVLFGGVENVFNQRYFENGFLRAAGSRARWGDKQVRNHLYSCSSVAQVARVWRSRTQVRHL